MLPSNPVLFTRPDGRLAWRFDDGTILPHIAGGAGEGDGGAGGGGDDKKFTQADVDRMIQERLARAKTEPPPDYEDLKKAKTELDQLKAKSDADAAAKLTEDEKTAQRIAALEEKVAQAQTATEAATAAALDEKRRSAVVAAAAAQKAAKPDQVFALLKKDAVTIGDDGQVTGAEEAVKQFLTDNPHFVGKTGPKPDPAQGHRGDAKEAGAAGRAEAAKRFAPKQTAAAGAQK